MKVSTSITVALFLVISHSDAFSVSPIYGTPNAGPRCAPLAAKTSNNLLTDFAKGAGIFSAAVAIISGATNPVNAVEMLPEAQPIIALESSSVAVSLGEFADFSMPSYKVRSVVPLKRLGILSQLPFVKGREDDFIVNPFLVSKP